jgi:fibro-slime domain-containing protein
MSKLGSRLSYAFGLLCLGSVAVGIGGCTAGVKPTQATGNGGTGGGSGGTGPGTGGTGTTGAGGAGAHPITCDGGSCMLPVPPGCGDGINNQGGIEQCDDGNTLAGDGCNGACKVEPGWTCPPAGACTRIYRCGNGVIEPGEVCDDGNTVDGDGCNSTCTVQDGRYTCMAGKPCVLTSICGNKRVESGENCDDGNAISGDGCSSTCQIEQGYVCLAPGSPCMRAPRCGDGIVQPTLGEVCDDGNTMDGDGCSADCKIVGAGCSCVPGKLCVCPQVKCGDGMIEGNEACDDGNTKSGDGCSATCTLESGYVCPLRNAPCVPNCGDGVIIGTEQCDPGIAVEKNACSSTCRWNPGWACTGTPTPTECHATTCGDGKKEGSEGCDDGNTVPYDGCSSTCQVEPNCTASGPCTGKCGDGILLSGEQCDDGNNVSGDGCSSTCQIESGFMCKQPPLGPTIQVPMVNRDFKFHMPADFEPGATGVSTATTGLVDTMLNAAGKPVFVAANMTAHINSAATFAEWYTDVPGTNHTTAQTLTLCNITGTNSYVNRWGPNCEQWATTAMAYYCGNVGAEQTDANGNPIPCTSKYGSTDCDTNKAMGYTMLTCTQSGGNWVATFQTGTLDGTPVFFPIDSEIAAGGFSAGEGTAAKIPFPYDPSGSYPPETPSVLHNFSFTSEIRYWFLFDSTKNYKLDFLGDDDLWIFVNKRLAVDIGGIHTAQPGTVTVSATNAFGMTNGNVYEVEAFQAERQTTSSTFKLTLSGFNSAPTACGPICGDMVVTAPEQCDNGTAANTGGYNKCTPDCKLGPFCGDGNVDAGYEQCDNGKNTDAYGANGGCAPGCVLPARCGDAMVQANYGETCDDGVNDGSYGGCTKTCQRAAYCGDGIKNGNEQCDDGANDGTYNTCGDPTMPLPNCNLGPRCGDGIVQSDYGEECEPTGPNDPNCTVACKKPGICGDGVVQPPEQCDYGVTGNDGSYGGCSPGCLLAPHCGDGVKNGPEECDDGVNDNSYGGCSPQCKLAPHCGDGHTDMPYEQCDDGAANGPSDACSSVCKLNVQ